MRCARRCLRALSSAHQRLVGATTGLVLEAVAPYSERLREVAGQDRRDARCRSRSAERKRADLERKFATDDRSQPAVGKTRQHGVVM